MKINLILPFINKTGGIAVLMEHARHLKAMGHDLRAYYPLLPYMEYWYEEKSRFKKIYQGLIKTFLYRLRHYYRRATWYPHPHELVPVLRIADRYIREADVVIATAWPTAYSVSRLDPRKGRKFYFIQGYEQWISDPVLVDESYRLPLAQITIAPWLTELMKSKFGREVVAEVQNGVDLERFRPPPARTWSSMQVLMIYHYQKVKGTDDGLKVLEEIHRRFPAVRVALFGIVPFKDCPPYIEFHHDPDLNTIVRLYQESQIFLSPSHNEGWHLPPMEAMACQCAVVATQVGCIPSLDDGDNMLVAQPGDCAALEAKIAFLVEHPEECRRIAMNGYRTIQDYGWKKASAKLAEALASGSGHG